MRGLGLMRVRVMRGLGKISLWLRRLLKWSWKWFRIERRWIGKSKTLRNGLQSWIKKWAMMYMKSVRRIITYTLDVVWTNVRQTSSSRKRGEKLPSKKQWCLCNNTIVLKRTGGGYKSRCTQINTKANWFHLTQTKKNIRILGRLYLRWKEMPHRRFKTFRMIRLRRCFLLTRFHLRLCLWS